MFATIDVGTNSVLLLVAQRDAQGVWQAVRERAEITRLGRGVDEHRVLAEASMEATIQVLARYADEARKLGVTRIAATATSAARDAKNGAEFLKAVHERTGLTLEILSGDEEARLSFESVARDPAVAGSGSAPLAVLDIGGGSTELVVGQREGGIDFRRSFDVGSVRLAERFVKHDPPSSAEREAVAGFLRETFSAAPAPVAGLRLVGVAGTVTSLLAIADAVQPYDPKRIHGGRLTLGALRGVTERLFELPSAERQKLPGLQPKRADVIPQGALILVSVMERLELGECWVSDRGLRWGLLQERFG